MNNRNNCSRDPDQNSCGGCKRPSKCANQEWEEVEQGRSISGRYDSRNAEEVTSTPVLEEVTVIPSMTIIEETTLPNRGMRTLPMDPPLADIPVTLPSFPDSSIADIPVTLPSFPDSSIADIPVTLPSFPDSSIADIPVTLPSFPDSCTNGCPVTPDNSGTQSRYCRVRFLHAAPNETSFNVSIGSQRVASNLAYGNLSEYRSVPDGFRTITIMNTRRPRAILFQKALPLRGGQQLTLAIINTSSGIEIIPVSDQACISRPSGVSCLRMANLALNNPPLDLLLNDGRCIFRDVRFKEISTLNRIRPGVYNLIVTETPQVPTPRAELVDVETVNDMPIAVSERFVPGYGEVNALMSFRLAVRANTMYTIYVIGGGKEEPDLQVVIAENSL